MRKQELRYAGEKLKGLLAGKKFILLSRQAHVRGKPREAWKDTLKWSRLKLKNARK